MKYIIRFNNHKITVTNKIWFKKSDNYPRISVQLEFHQQCEIIDLYLQIYSVRQKIKYRVT